MEKNLASCIYCHEVRSAKGIFTHVDRAHLKLTKYSNGHNKSYHLFTKKAEEKYLRLDKKCLNCQSLLDFNKRNQKFCNRSCSAQYTNAKKDFSKIKTGPAKKEKLSYNKVCKGCNIIFDTLKKEKCWCSKACFLKNRYSSIREKRPALINYRSDCAFRFNLKDYPEEFNFSLVEQYGWYSASNRKNNLNGVSRDHIISVKYGFDNNIDPKIISHPANCRLVRHSENSSKRDKNLLTLEELLIKIEKWNNKYKR